MTQTGNYDPLGSESSESSSPAPEQASQEEVTFPGEATAAGFPPADGPAESTPVEPTPTAGDQTAGGTETAPATTDEIQTNQPFASSVAAPVSASDRPLYPTGETFEQRALGLLQTIRSNGMNQILADEIDRLITWFHNL